jgi:hypothetical protein
MVSLRWFESLAKAPLQATTRGPGLARDRFSVAGIKGATLVEGCGCGLSLCCADNELFVAIVNPAKTAAPTAQAAPIEAARMLTFLVRLKVTLEQN